MNILFYEKSVEIPRPGAVSEDDGDQSSRGYR
jgi:hypothetical protein